jgi:plastocyanin
MRSISLIRGRRPVAFGAAAIATLLLVAMTASVPAAGRGEQRSHRRARPVRVNISDFSFHPQTLRVKRGSKVVFVNRDSAVHTATRRGSFDTGSIRRGRAAVVKLRRAGVYAYHCTIHPSMRGKIVVR